MFANMFEFLVKMMQMVEVAHTKFIRQYKLLPNGIRLMESEQQLEFIFMVKERVFRNDSPEVEAGKDLRYMSLLKRFIDEARVFSERD